MLRNPEELPLVLADQRVVGRDIPRANSLDEGDVGVRLVLFCYWFDGRNGNRMLKIATDQVRESVVAGWEQSK